MKKWTKRILISLAVLGVLGVAFMVGARHLQTSKPEWYPKGAPDPAAIAAAAKSMQNKLFRVQGWAASSRAKETRAANGIPTSQADIDGDPAPAETITFTGAEFNAFFARWDDDRKWSDRYKGHVSDPVLVLRDNRIILAATVKDMNSVVSAHFEPRLVPDPDSKDPNDKKLKLEVAGVASGRLWLPEFTWVGYRDKLVALMNRKIEQARPEVNIHPDGSANEAAVIVAMNTLLLHALNDEPAEPVLFLPHDQAKTGYPVKLTDVKVANDSITLTVVPLSARERTELLASLRKPSGKPYAGTAKPEPRAAAGRRTDRQSVASPDARPVLE
jgi:hypothetical protein